MPDPEDPNEHGIVLKAFANSFGLMGYVSGYVEWKDDVAANRARQNLSDLDDSTPEGLRRLLLEYVRNQGEIRQSKETREERAVDYKYKYIAIVPCEGYPRGIFFELILVDDDDPDEPTVHIVSVHRNGV